MGFFDGRSYSVSESQSQRQRASSRSRTYSPERSKSSGYYVRPSQSSRSGSSSFFGNFGGSSSSRGWGNTSSYRRSPRQGYISYLMNKLQRMLRDLWQYARRHPLKAFFAVVVPLVSAGGAIHGLMRQVGVRSPLDGMTSRGGGGYYGSAGYGSSGGGGGFGGLMNNAGSLMQVAKAFM